MTSDIILIDGIYYKILSIVESNYTYNPNDFNHHQLKVHTTKIVNDVDIIISELADEIVENCMFYNGLQYIIDDCENGAFIFVSLFDSNFKISQNVLPNLSIDNTSTNFQNSGI